jgi:antitoxin YefM
MSKYLDISESAMSPIDVITYTALRENLAKVMDEVCDAGSYVVVTRQNARPVVMMSLAEFRSWEETIHLLRSPANATRLMESIADADAGKLEEHELIEPENITVQPRRSRTR